MTESWHAAPEVLRTYAQTPSLVDPTVADSVEQHLLRCGSCRAAVADAASPDLIEASWRALVADIAQPSPAPAGARGWIGAAGSGGTWLRLIAATPVMALQFLGLVIVVTAVAVLAAINVETRTPFLVAAPVLVLALVVVGFPPWREPIGEMAAATPLVGFRAFCIRSAVVLGASVLPLAGASLLLPSGSSSAFAWVLPALALAVSALALATRFDPVTVAGGLGLTWLTMTGVWAVVVDAPVEFGRLLGPIAQVTSIVVTAIGVLAVVRNRDALDHMLSAGGPP